MYDLHSCRDTYSLQRRLRIRTVQFEAARNINEIYDTVDPEVILSILVHEVNSNFRKVVVAINTYAFCNLGSDRRGEDLQICVICTAVLSKCRKIHFIFCPMHVFVKDCVCVLSTSAWLSYNQIFGFDLPYRGVC